MLPEHVDRNAAARIPIAPDPQIGGLDQLGDALADGDRRILVEGAVIAEAREKELERLRFEQPALGRVIDDEMGKIGLPGDRADTGEFRRAEPRGIERLRMRVGDAFEQGLVRGTGKWGGLPK